MFGVDPIQWVALLAGIGFFTIVILPYQALAWWIIWRVGRPGAGSPDRLPARNTWFRSFLTVVVLLAPWLYILRGLFGIR